MAGLSPPAQGCRPYPPRGPYGQAEDAARDDARPRELGRPARAEAAPGPAQEQGLPDGGRRGGGVGLPGGPEGGTEADRGSGGGQQLAPSEGVWGAREGGDPPGPPGAREAGQG